jgi:hypothetical protein
MEKKYKRVKEKKLKNAWNKTNEENGWKYKKENWKRNWNFSLQLQLFVLLSASAIGRSRDKMKMVFGDNTRYLKIDISPLLCAYFHPKKYTILLEKFFRKFVLKLTNRDFIEQHDLFESLYNEREKTKEKYLFIILYIFYVRREKTIVKEKKLKMTFLSVN